jgi:hypothetical protein
MTSLDHSFVHVPNEKKKYLMCKCKYTFFKKVKNGVRIRLGMVQDSKC